MKSNSTRPPQPGPISIQPKNQNQNNSYIELNLHDHELKRLNNRSDEIYIEGFNCDYCGRSSSNSDFSYNCDKCSLDCCELCYSLASRGKKNDNIHEHKLTPSSIERDDYICDICEKDLIKDIQSWQCKKCQFSACLKCYYKE